MVDIRNEIEVLCVIKSKSNQLKSGCINKFKGFFYEKKGFDIDIYLVLQLADMSLESFVKYNR